MKRFFGAGQATAPIPNIEDQANKVESRVETLDDKIKLLDVQLLQYKKQIQQTKPGPVQNGLRQKALRLMNQKRLLEHQQNQLYGQVANMQQIAFTTENMKDTIQTVAAMKSANLTMKAQMKQVKIEDIENITDDLQDLLGDANDLQELMGRTFATPAGMDESDLDAELNALYDETQTETDDEPPSYMRNRVAVPDVDPSQTAALRNLNAIEVPQASPKLLTEPLFR